MRTSEYRSQLRSESLEKQVTSSPDLSATGIADATLSKDRTHGPDRVVVHSILAGIILAMFLSALEQTIVAPALPAIGKSLAVLFEKPGRETGQLVGRTPHLQPVHVQGPKSLIGQVEKVKVEALTANSLHGALCESALA